jgi:ABC-type transport system involved in cytochrome c biogenesis permease subunit
MARGILGLAGIATGAVMLYFVMGGEAARLNLSSMRILWQLLKGGACSLVLLLGCNLLFEKRGGIVLLHAGVALLMFSELQVGIYGKENHLMLLEGQKTTFIRDIRERELAVIHRQSDGKDKVVVIPQAMLESAAAGTSPEQQIISLREVPFDIAVRKYIQNSELRAVLPDDRVRTPAGLGNFVAPVEMKPVTGMDDKSDLSSVYIDIVERGTGKVLSSHLISQEVSELRTVPIAEVARVGEQDYQLYLRSQRNYRPYEVELLDVSRTNYVGSATPRDYRSRIIIREPSAGTSEEFTLWMNNPLRYRGETFYQTSYQELPGGKEATTLSVVRNKGWMLPYIACMIVSFGMFAQFWQTVTRYLRGKERETLTPLNAQSDDSGSLDTNAASPVIPEALRKMAVPASRSETKVVQPGSVWSVLLPIAVVLICVAWLARGARVPKETDDAMALYSFAQIPIAWNGRAQPVDSFARTQLLMTSHKSTFQGELDRLELDARRDELIKAFTKAFPSVKPEALQGFSGSYSEWIEEMTRLTSSGVDAVEERMRPLMVMRMPAVRWFLDIAARPEMALRHRVIKIDDDQLLAALSLPKRAGLTFSLEEVLKHRKELEVIHNEASELQKNGQDNRMTTMQRRGSALFETVSRIDSMSNMFLVKESDGLVQSLIDSWRILRLLGDRPAVMGVPTGAENEQRSWETVVASNALLQLSRQLKEKSIASSETLSEYISQKLPQEMGGLVPSAIERTLQILASSVAPGTDPKAEGEQIQQNAANAAERMRENDPFLAEILGIIARAEPGKSAADIAAGVSPEKLQELAETKIGSQLFEVLSILNSENAGDPRLMEIRKRLQPHAANGEKALMAAMNTELARVAFEDINKRAGHLLPGGAQNEIFEQNASAVTGILAAWRTADVKGFNESVSAYRKALTTEKLPHVDAQVVAAEAWFNFYEPFYKATNLYLPILVLSFVGWFFRGRTLRNTGLWLMALGFIVHTVALLLRMWISGRPPVTNLYSSSIFIGWAVVVAAFVVEIVLKNGIGNILGASVGAATLMIAHYLALDEGDTMGVMQAVLDTTFWLATHVVCITLGYAATFLAGAIAIAYCVMAVIKKFPKEDGSLQSVGQMVYGSLCFALFFSLVGTVLGGLWADDSWGRFWGWDPKENGAMLIVMWNAVILHARWDKMVRDYGTAVLAIGGNIVTAWSWFGVNELKAGLHTYGFTEGRLYALATFVEIQAALILLAVLVAWFHRRSQAAVRTGQL